MSDPFSKFRTAMAPRTPTGTPRQQSSAAHIKHQGSVTTPPHGPASLDDETSSQVSTASTQPSTIAPALVHTHTTAEMLPSMPTKQSQPQVQPQQPLPQNHLQQQQFAYTQVPYQYVVLPDGRVAIMLMQQQTVQQVQPQQQPQLPYLVQQQNGSQYVQFAPQQPQVMQQQCQWQQQQQQQQGYYQAQPQQQQQQGYYQAQPQQQQQTEAQQSVQYMYAPHPQGTQVSAQFQYTAAAAPRYY